MGFIAYSTITRRKKNKSKKEQFNKIRYKALKPERKEKKKKREKEKKNFFQATLQFLF